FLDGWNDLYLTVLEMLEPHLRPGALVAADMSRDDPHHARYRAHMGDPAHGYLTTELPLDDGVVLSVRLGWARDTIIAREGSRRGRCDRCGRGGAPSGAGGAPLSCGRAAPAGERAIGRHDRPVPGSSPSRRGRPTGGARRGRLRVLRGDRHALEGAGAR